MRPVTCAEVRQSVIVAVRDGRLPADLGSFSSHIMSCALCRGAVALLIGDALQATPPLPIIPCEDCLAKLPTMIDLADESAAEALRSYPEVWLHLWSCEGCAETYMLTRAMVEAEHLEPFIPKAVSWSAQPQGSVRHALHVSRAILNHLLTPPSLQLGAARGADSADTIVLDEQLAAGQRITVRVTEQLKNEWQVSVAIMPPAAGSVELHLGVHVFRTLFGLDGIATVGSVPASLLTAPDGPDLVVACNLSV